MLAILVAVLLTPWGPGVAIAKEFELVVPEEEFFIRLHQDIVGLERDLAPAMWQVYDEGGNCQA